MEDLYKLFQIMLDGHHNGDLQNRGEFQTNWYTHALWGLYQAITKFFWMRLAEYDLRWGTPDKPTYHLYSGHQEVWHASEAQSTGGAPYSNS